jgi:hypothetical protein
VQTRTELEHWSQHHLAVVADSRVHGRSTRTTAPLTFDLMASDYLRIGKLSLVGVRDGAIIGLDIAINHL